MELDHGTQHIIDVQPDFRFPFQFKILFNAYLLICDLYSKELVSYHASSYKNDPTKMDFLTKLLDRYVPSDLEFLLNGLAPTLDAQRRLQLFVPTLAGFDFTFDFGRIVPPSMMILAHHLP